MTTLRWSGFADLTFAESARLALARAVERAETEVMEQQPGAWLIEDRRIAFSIESETAPAVVVAVKRLLDELVHEACGGEAFVEVANPPERWVRKANVPAVSAAIQVASDDPRSEAMPTIRSAAS